MHGNSYFKNKCFYYFSFRNGRCVQDYMSVPLDSSWVTQMKIKGHLHPHLKHRSFEHKTFGGIMMKNDGLKIKVIVLVILLQSVKFNMVVWRGKWTKFLLWVLCILIYPNYFKYVNKIKIWNKLCSFNCGLLLRILFLQFCTCTLSEFRVWG